MMSFARSPAVAGTFYPADAVSLSGQVKAFLGEAQLDMSDEDMTRPPKALIAPHAGYIYSGPIAAQAYIRIQSLKDIVKRVVVLGPCHRVAVNGLALSSADTFTTPLGPVEIDHGLDEALLALPQMQVYDDTHSQEHSLEVHIPFLQVLLNDFKLLPMVVGQSTPDEVAEVLDTVWGGPETLVVISTDLSHYLDYDAAQRLDQQTCRAIETLDINAIGDKQACGRMPVKGLLALVRRKGLSIQTLDLRNSGDTAGPRDQVVGYGAWALWENTP